jgi:hypothetical protein
MCYYADIPGFELCLPLLLYLKGHTRHLKFMRSCSNYSVGAIEHYDEMEFSVAFVYLKVLQLYQGRSIMQNQP